MVQIRKRNFSKVGTGTVKNIDGSATLIRLLFHVSEGAVDTKLRQDRAQENITDEKNKNNAHLKHRESIL
jgi:hypothetical protein